MNDILAKVQDYKTNLNAEAEEMIMKKFPRKLLELDTLLKTEKFNRILLKEVHSELLIPKPEELIPTKNDVQNKKRKLDSVENAELTGCKVLVLPHGSVPCNRHIVELIDELKPHIRQLVEDTNLLKMWIQLLIPRIEDGNNFGVSIQEETLSEIRTVESEAAAFFDQLSRYFITRGKIISKVAKYPHISDYRRTINELDEKEFVSLRLVLCELRNQYSTLYDLITKNMEKIKKPRSSNNEAMYQC